MMKDGIKAIDNRMNSFKRRYYLNLSIKGAILTFSLILLYFLIVSLIEYNLWLSGWARFTILLSFFGLVAFCIYRFLKEPLAWWIYHKGLGQEESALLIGSHFPAIKDRLLNLIQLAAIKHESDLLNAGIIQKSRQFENVAFESAIDLSENKKYLKYFLIPFGIMLVIFVLNQGILTQSTQRIVQFNREFSPEAPFQFAVQNEQETPAQAIFPSIERVLLSC